MNPEEYYPIPPTKIQKAIICTPEEVQMWKDENLKLKTRITALEAQVAALKKIAENDHPLAESDWGVAYRLRTYRTLHAPGAVDDGGKR